MDENRVHTFQIVLTGILQMFDKRGYNYMKDYYNPLITNYDDCFKYLNENKVFAIIPASIPAAEPTAHPTQVRVFVVIPPEKFKSEISKTIKNVYTREQEALKGFLNVIVATREPIKAKKDEEMNAVNYDPNSPFTMELFSFEQLIGDYLQYYTSPDYRILSEEEANQVTKNLHCKETELQKLFEKDRAIKIIGAKPGNIVEVTRKSTTTGISTVYKYVTGKKHAIKL